MVALAACVLVWQVGARLDDWVGVAVPGVSALPSPVEVVVAAARVVTEPGYWVSWALSFVRVMGGFFIALVTAVPLGLLFATSRTFRAIAFPVFEVIRPIPPLAPPPAPAEVEVEFKLDSNPY